MSGGHHARRRRSYGRRQHELYERRLRGDAWPGFDGADGTLEALGPELLDALRPRGSRVFDLLTPRSGWLAEAG